MVHVDRRLFLASLGGAVAVKMMSSEAKAEALGLPIWVGNMDRSAFLVNLPDAGSGRRWNIYFVNNQAVQAVTLRVAGEAIQPGVPRQLFSIGNPNLVNSSHYAVRGSHLRFAVSPDGQSFLFAQPPAAGPAGRGAPPRGGRGTVAEGLLGVVEQPRGGGLGVNPPNEISVILNWPRLMKKEITAR